MAHVVKMNLEDIQIQDQIRITNSVGTCEVLYVDRHAQKLVLFDMTAVANKTVDLSEYEGTIKYSEEYKKLQPTDNLPNGRETTWSQCEMYYGIPFDGYATTDPIKQIALKALKGDPQCVDLIKMVVERGE
jgi:hypothetical protein